MSSTIRIIGFDVDGTLLDTLHPIYSIDSNIIRAYAGKTPSLQEWRSNFQGTTDWKAFYRAFGVPEEKITEAIEQFYAQALPQPQAIPGAQQTIEHITQEKFIISLHPNKEKLLSNLETAHLLQYFNQDLIFATEKGKAVSLRNIGAMMGVEQRSIAYVGDSLSDVVEGQKAHVQTIALASQKSFCSEERLRAGNLTYIITALEQLQGLLS